MRNMKSPEWHVLPSDTNPAPEKACWQHMWQPAKQAQAKAVAVEGRQAHQLDVQRDWDDVERSLKRSAEYKAEGVWTELLPEECDRSSFRQASRKHKQLSKMAGKVSGEHRMAAVVTGCTQTGPVCVPGHNPYRVHLG